MIILDSDVMIDLLRQYPPAVDWLRHLGEEELVLPGYVVMELIQGCSNKIEQSKLETTIEGIEIVWPLPDTCDDALSIFGQFHLSHGIGFLDALIGQMAISLDLPLHTFNRKHYSVIPNLETIQPYIKS